ncbi:hypothetical protein DYB35_000874 [Aphanomyces astaci]|uniref:Uncharacterized protein n=1 Tax=Aphanomyces astaci TaxID=112090 RepID=A0A418D5N3_APHAT|nr:hypothetical protein DYB35_000874 [Aphanomyces astaci]
MYSSNPVFHWKFRDKQINTMLAAGMQSRPSWTCGRSVPTQQCCIEERRDDGIGLSGVHCLRRADFIRTATTRCIVSPCVRTIETFEEILSAWGEDAHHIPWTEEPRIREQDFGNFQDPEQIRQCKSQRRKFGSFFYRFPSGESPADVFDRISSFLESLHRMFARHPQQNYILVTHGVTIRVLLMRYFKLPISHFDQMENFHNAEFIVLEHVGCSSSFKMVKLVHANVNPDTKEAAPVVSPCLRLRDCGAVTQSKYASSFEKEALY